MAHVLRDGGHLAIMVDQKLNEGLDILFLVNPRKRLRHLLHSRCAIDVLWCQRVLNDYQELISA